MPKRNERRTGWAAEREMLQDELCRTWQCSVTIGSAHHTIDAHHGVWIVTATAEHPIGADVRLPERVSFVWKVDRNYTEFYERACYMAVSGLYHQLDALDRTPPPNPPA